MALSRSMKQYMMAPSGTDPRRADTKVRPALGTFGTAQNEMRRRQQPLSSRGREKGRALGRNPAGPIKPPRSRVQTSGTAADRARSAGLLTGGARGTVMPRSAPGTVASQPTRPGAAGGMVRRAVGQPQRRLQAARGGKPRPPAGAFGFLGRQTQRPGFGGSPGPGRRGGSRQYLR